MDYLAEFLQHKSKLKKVYSRTKSDQEFRKEKVKEQAKVDKVLEKLLNLDMKG